VFHPSLFERTNENPLLNKFKHYMSVFGGTLKTMYFWDVFLSRADTGMKFGTSMDTSESHI
jgi:hypothetical protein